MGTQLHVVQPGASVAAQHAPRVFTALFQERLGKINHAERELRSLGLRVEWSNVTPKGELKMRIHREANVSLAPLLDRMGPRSFLDVRGRTLVAGLFDGVVVSWIEPGASHELVSNTAKESI